LLRKFTKLYGLLRIEKLGLLHPSWQFILPEKLNNFDFRSRFILFEEFSPKDADKWTIRTCLLEPEDRGEYGLKKAVGIKKEEVRHKLNAFSRYYKERKSKAIFVVYPYFEAEKSGIIEISRSRVLIEAVWKDQWYLTEEAVEWKDRRLYEGPRNRLEASKFVRKIVDWPPILTHKDLEELTNYALKIPDNDVLLEWSYTPDKELLFYDMRKLFKGKEASPGIIRGKVRIISDISELREVKEGEILVLKQLTKEISPFIRSLPKKVGKVGIIAELGAFLSHPAIICREYKVPLVVDAKDVTKTLKNGMLVEMNGSNGTYSLLM